MDIVTTSQPAPTVSERGSIELIVLGLLAALIVVLAMPVLDIGEDHPTLIDAPVAGTHAENDSE
jgi:hypothetical protein